MNAIGSIVRHEGHFHNVGQGLFYSGYFNITLGGNSKIFNYIIDCGASDFGNKNGYGVIYRYALNLEIELYKKDIIENNNSLIDLFVISHMHSDHVNGLLELLKSNIHIKKLFLPYLEASQRLVIYTFFLLENNARKNDYLEFIIDPIEFLKRYDSQIDDIVFISESNKEPLKVDYNERFNDNYNDQVIGEIDIELDRVANSRYSKARVYKECYLFLRNLIQFEFFRKNINKIKLESFIKELKGSTIDDKYMKSKKNHTKLRKAYKKIFGENKFNDTSLCVWMTYIDKPYKIYEIYERNTGAITSKYELCDINEFYFYKCAAFHRLYNYFDEDFMKLSKKFGYVFPGDVDISKLDDFEFFASHCEDISNRVSIFCVQHHGSEHNWNKELLRTFPYSKWVVSYGTDNSHEHPDSIVERDIKDNDMTFIRVNEQKDFIHRVELYYEN